MKNCSEKKIARGTPYKSMIFTKILIYLLPTGSLGRPTDSDKTKILYSKLANNCFMLLIKLKYKFSKN